jgi:hypothetical protein
MVFDDSSTLMTTFGLRAVQSAKKAAGRCLHTTVSPVNRKSPKKAKLVGIDIPKVIVYAAHCWHDLQTLSCRLSGYFA